MKIHGDHAPDVLEFAPDAPFDISPVLEKSDTAILGMPNIYTVQSEDQMKTIVPTPEDGAVCYVQDQEMTYVHTGGGAWVIMVSA